METSIVSRSAQIFKWSLIVGIVIVLNLFYNYTLSLVFSKPEHLNFCPQKQINVVPGNQTECLSEGGSWTAYPFNQKKFIEGDPLGDCDQYFSCNQKFEEASKVYDRNVFIVLVILGVITFVLGLVFMKIEILSMALSIGAVLDFVIASIRYWARADDLIKVLILGVALAVLIWVSIKRFNASNPENQNK